MKKNKFLAVSMRYDRFKNISETRNSIDFRLIEWVYRLGFEPLLIPNNFKFYINLERLKIAGIILTGGNDIKKNCIRNKVETKILKYSLMKNIPILGICHGMQIMSKFENGKLKKIKNHVSIRHKIISKDKNYPQTVNSYHNFAIYNLKNTFEVIAVAEDGNIEAIKHKSYPWLGWMWHPERNKIFDKKLIKLAKKLFRL